MYPPLHLDASSFLFLLGQLGPSLGLWRAAEVAALREHRYARPVLDIGCGDGLVTSMVLPRVEIGCDPYGESVRRASALAVYGRLEERPVEDAGLPEGAFATVLANSVLEHVPSPDPILATAARVLAPGGRFVMTAPTEAFALWLLLPSVRYGAWRNRRLVHINTWTAGRWAETFSRFGLSVVSVRPYMRRALVAAWDAMDLAEQVWLAKRRLAGLAWRALPRAVLVRLAALASRLDLSAADPGGGRLIIAVKEG